MRPNKNELDLREHVAFYIGEGGQKLGEGSIRWLAREQRLEDLLLKLAHKASSRMEPIFKKALCITTSATKRKHEETARERELYGGHGRGKRTKIDMNNKFAEHVLDRSPAAGICGEAHITTEIDTPISCDRSGEADEPSAGEDQDAKAQDGEAPDGEAPDGEAPDGEDQDGEDQDEESQDAKAQDVKAQDAKVQDGEAQDAQAQDGKDQDGENQDGEGGEEASGTRTKAGVHIEEDLEMNSELGLTRGNEDIVASITEQFFAQPSDYRTRSQIDLSPILRACRNLDFHMAKVLLVNYLLDRLTAPGAKDMALPLTSDTKEPDEIFDVLIIIGKKSDDIRIHQAFQRMNFFAAVNDKTTETTVSARIKTLERYAARKAGTVAKELRGQLADKYKAEYHMGRRWLDVAKWFGGTGIVLVFIVAGTHELQYIAHRGLLTVLTCPRH
jgi:hypothetical protein